MLLALAPTFSRPPRAQQPTADAERVAERLRQTLDEALRTGDPEPARRLVDELGTASAPLVPLLHDELDHEDPATWLTARAILARASVFHTPGQLTRSYPMDGVLIGTLNAKSKQRGEQPVPAAELRNAAAAHSAEQDGRSRVAPHAEPASWIEAVRDSRNPFTVELAAKLIQRNGSADDAGTDALAHRLRGGVHPIRSNVGLHGDQHLLAERAVARAMLAVGSDSPKAAAALGILAFGADTPEDERRRARAALRQLGPGAAGACPRIRNALSGEDTLDNFEFALELAPGLGARGLTLVASLEDLVAMSTPDNASAKRATAAADAIRTAAIRQSLSPDDPSKVGARGIAMRRQIDAMLEELFTTDDPERFDALLERVTAFGPFAAQALVDRALASHGGSRLRGFDRLGMNHDLVRVAARLGPAADAAVRRVHEKIGNAPPDLALDLVWLLTRWLPWCQPFEAREFPLVGNEQLLRLVVEITSPAHVRELGSFDRLFAEQGIDPALLTAAPPVLPESDDAGLLAAVKATSPTALVLAAEALRERGDVSEQIVMALMSRAASDDLQRFVEAGGSMARLVECPGACAWALMEHAPETLDTRTEFEALFRIHGLSLQDLTRIVRRLEQLRSAAPATARPWAVELLFTAWTNAPANDASTLRLSLLRTLAAHAPLTPEQRTRFEQLLARIEAAPSEEEQHLIDRIRDGNR